MSLKKKLCNPPAQEIARCGDPLVLGHFLGAGEGLDRVPESLKGWFEESVVKVEADYVAERTELAQNTVARMQEIFAKVLAADAETGISAKKRETGPSHSGDAPRASHL